jgi:hypothetical protein
MIIWRERAGNVQKATKTVSQKQGAIAEGKEGNGKKRELGG